MELCKLKNHLSDEQVPARVLKSLAECAKQLFVAHLSLQQSGIHMWVFVIDPFKTSDHLTALAIMGKMERSLWNAILRPFLR